MVKKILTLILLSSVALAAQGSGTPSTLRVITDANGYLAVSGAAQTAPLITSLFSNTRLKTDANGYLVVIITGGTITGPIFAPVETDCSVVAYSFVGRTTTGLNSHAANTWNLCGGGVLGLSGNTTSITSSLQLILPDGTAASPGLKFSDGGWYFDAGNGLSASISGSRRLSLYNGGFVFIGAGTATTPLMQLGGLTSAFPMLKRNNTAVNFRLADDSADAPVSFSTSTASIAYAASGTGTSVANVGANSCGTTAASIVGNQFSGVITVGATAGTQCRVTFTTAAPNTRECTVTDSTTTIATRSTYVDTTNTDFLGAFVAGDKVTYICAVR